jgi:hypothetical protein
VQAASEGYCAYLQRCQQYGLLRGPLAAAYSAEEAGSSVDPGTARNQRIERFKHSRAVAGLMQAMRGRRKQADEEVRSMQGWCTRLTSRDTWQMLRVCLASEIATTDIQHGQLSLFGCNRIWGLR